MRKVVLIIYALLWVATEVMASVASDRTVIKIEQESGITDYTDIVRQHIETCPKGNIQMEFAPGIYHFYPEKAIGKYLAVSNNDNGYKRIAFDFDNMSGISILGDNTTFIFHGRLVPFCFRSCKQVEVAGISIDYDYPFVFEGKVMESDKTNNSFTLKVHPDNPYQIIGKRFFFKGYDWKSPLGENIVFSALTHRPVYHTSLYEHANTVRELEAEELSPGIVRFTGVVSADVPPVGSIYTDKGPHGENRQIPGIIVQDCAGVKINNVTIYRSGAMAFIAERSRDLSLHSYNVCLHEDSDRMISASADATHFVGCRGHISLENCRFESMLDDGTNIHGVYMKVVNLIDSHTIGVQFGHFQQEGYDFGAVGDSIAFIDRSGLNLLAVGCISAIQKTNENYYQIKTNVNVSSFDTGNLSIVNLSDNPEVHVNKCSVRYNRARSLLISTLAPVIIENSYFSSMMAGIRICGDANYWFESGPVGYVIIRNNTFDDLGIGGHSPQAILQIDPVIPLEARDKALYHGTIDFENNVIRTFDAQIIYALSVNNLIIRNNKFIQTKQYQPLFSDLSIIDVQNCGNLLIENNDYSLWKDNSTISIKKCKSPVVRGEKLLPVVVNPNRYFYQN